MDGSAAMNQNTATKTAKAAKGTAVPVERVRALVSEAEIDLHSPQAVALWSGVRTIRNDIGIRPAGVVSVPIVSNALRFAYLGSGNNPWLDFSLLRFEDGMQRAESVLRERKAAAEEILASLAQGGLRIAVMRNNAPQIHALPLFTPYHSQLAQIMLLFDSVVRLFLTLSSSGQVPRSSVNNTINDLRSCLTSPFEAVVRETGAVRRSEIALTRALLASEPVDTPEAIAAKAEVMAATQKDEA
jgi:hypothetical protein